MLSKAKKCVHNVNGIWWKVEEIKSKIYYSCHWVLWIFDTAIITNTTQAGRNRERVPAVSLFYNPRSKWIKSRVWFRIYSNLIYFNKFLSTSTLFLSLRWYTKISSYFVERNEEWKKRDIKSCNWIRNKLDLCISFFFSFRFSLFVIWHMRDLFHFKTSS